MTTSVLVLGYFGFGNAGDDAIGTATVRELQNLSSGTNVIATTGPERIFAQEDVQTIPFSLKAILLSTTKVDKLVVTGGTHFHTIGNSASRLKVYLFYLLLIIWAKIWRTEVDMVTHGIGPVNGRIFGWMTHAILRFADGVSVRDRKSVREIASLSSDRFAETVEIGFDVAPLLNDATKRPSVNKSDTVPDKSDLTLGVSVTPAFSKYYDNPRNDDKLVNRLSQAIEKEVDEGRVDDVIIFALHSGEFNDDLTMSRNLDSALKGASTEVRIYENDPEAFINSICEADRFVGMKYHSLVFSYLCEIPTLGISYHPKCSWFMEYTGYNTDASITMHEAVDSGLQYQLSQLVTNPELFSPTMSTSKAKSLAKRSFSVIRNG